MEARHGAEARCLLPSSTSYRCGKMTDCQSCYGPDRENDIYFPCKTVSVGAVMEILLVIIGIPLLLILSQQFGKTARKDLREGLSATQTFFALFAIILAVVWFIQTRPDAPRVQLDLASELFRYEGRVLIHATATIANNGQTALRFEDSKATSNRAKSTPSAPHVMTFGIAAILPPSPEDAPEADSRSSEVPAPPYLKRDHFDPIRTDAVRWSGMLEAGEKNDVSYDVLVDCDQGDVLSLTVALDKPLQGWEKWWRFFFGPPPNTARKPQEWRKQVVIDLANFCYAKPEKISENTQ